MPPEQTSIWRPALAIGLAVMIATALGSHLLLEAGLRRSMPTLEDATGTGAAAVGQAVARQIAHALDLGIPLDEIPGVEPYLQRIAEGSPQVEGMALLDAAGKRIASTDDDVEGAGFPVDGGGVRATLIVAAESPLIDRAIDRIRIALAIASLFAGIVAAGIVAASIAFHRDPIRRRLLADMEGVAAGDFRVSAPSADDGPVSEAARTLLRGIDRVDAARRRLFEAIATIRAVDFDGSLGRQVDVILHPVESRYKFADADDLDAADPAVRGAGVAWRLALFLGLYCTALPYVANFAIDRESEAVAAAWAPILPLIAEFLGLVLGVVISRTPLGRSAGLISLGCLMLAGSLIATYWCRTYELFVVLRCIAGVAAGLVATAFVVHRRHGLPRREMSALIAFAALLVAPLLAGLYAEAIGRRSGFLVLGVVVLVAWPFVALGAGRLVQPRPERLAAGSLHRADLLLALAVLPAAAMLIVRLPAGIGPGGYLAATGAAAMLAASALLAPKAATWVYGIAMLVVGVPLSFSDSGLLVSMFAPCALVGLASGGLFRTAVTEAGRPWAAIAIGTAAGLVVTGAAASAGIPFAAIVAGVGLAILGVGLLGRPSSALQPV